MRVFVSSLFTFILLLAVASAQTSPAAAPKTTAQKTKASTTGAAATTGSKPAITLERVCTTTTATKAFDKTCKTVVTEAEMDRLIGALNPEMSPAVRQNLGKSMAEWIAYSAKARELGLDKTKDFAEVVRFARTQLLAQALARDVQKKAEVVSPAELQAYYDSHKKDLEEFNFIRVIVPRATPSKDKPVDEAAETQYAQQIRDRLAKGEDPKALQTEAFKHSASEANEPPVEINGRKRGSVPPSQSAIFDLKDSEVSQVLPDPAAFFIYKLVSHSIMPLDKATPEVKKALIKERLEQAITDLNSQFEVKLSESYFGPQPQSAPMGAPSMRGGAPQSAPPAKSAPTTPPPAASQPTTQTPTQPPANPQVPKQ